MRTWQPGTTFSSPRRRPLWLGMALALLALTTAPFSPADEGYPMEERTTFEAMDSDDSGTLSRYEASGNSQLLDHWDSADINWDNRIDRAEFSAFELTYPQDTSVIEQPSGGGYEPVPHSPLDNLDSD